MSNVDHRLSTSSNRSDTSRFPDFETSPVSLGNLTIHEEEYARANGNSQKSFTLGSEGRIGSPHTAQAVKWPSRKESFVSWSQMKSNGATRHGRQKSLSDAFKTIRSRKGSVTANAQEIADALKAPVSFKLVVREDSIIESRADHLRLSVSSGISALP